MSDDRLALLDLLWPLPDGVGPDVAALSPSTWQVIDHCARQHRLRPLLHARAKQCEDWSAPADIARKWQAVHRRSALRALAQRAELQRIGGLFAQAGLHATLLKGGAIVGTGTIDPALRPLRDLDLLLAEGDLGPAHRLLLAAGYTGVQADFDREAKHLPLLTSPAGVHVELHGRLIDTPQTGRAQAEARWQRAAMARSRALTTGPVAPTSPTDTLLHIVLHGVLDHRFNNGPLLLVDIACLTTRTAIDWDLFWTEADALDARRACRLALHLAARRGLGGAIVWPHAPESPPSARVLRQAETMMLIDLDRISELGWAGQIASSARGNRLARFMAMLGRGFRRSLPDGPARAASRWAVIGRIAATYRHASSWRHLTDSLSVSRWLAGP